ncbi:MAG: hypothetical protein EBT39_03250, partial [Sphingobacteriia bacterium]|nr:hypothetical protein [Candidatus Fonsibacter lacus]
KYTTFRKMTQELAQEIVPRLGLRYKPNLTLNPLRQHSLMPTFGKRPPLTMDLVKRIIQEEKVTKFEDLIQRRLSIIENPADLKDVMGLSVQEIRDLFQK